MKTNLPEYNPLGDLKSIFSKTFLKDAFVKPISPLKYFLSKSIYYASDFYFKSENRNGPILNDKFIIKKESINNIIQNLDKNKTYMHIFFTSNEDDDIILIFRFSDLKEFDDSNWDINKATELAYRLKNGSLNNVTNNILLNNSSNEFKSFVNSKFPPSCRIKPTLYIKYEIDDLKEFNEFEQDITLEFGCEIDNSNNVRLCLLTIIEDTNRSGGHKYPIDKDGKLGYYDMGTLYP